MSSTNMQAIAFNMQLLAYTIGNTVDSVVDKIRIKRKALGLTQAELAHQARIPQRTYADYERGLRAIPHDRLMDIARALGTTLAELDPVSKSLAFPPMPETVGNMTPAQLREALQFPAMPNDELELSRLRARLKSVPEDLLDSWPNAHPGAKAISLYLITGDPEFVALLPAEIQAKLKVLLRALQMAPLAPKP